MNTSPVSEPGFTPHYPLTAYLGTGYALDETCLIGTSEGRCVWEREEAQGKYLGGYYPLQSDEEPARRLAGREGFVTKAEMTFEHPLVLNVTGAANLLNYDRVEEIEGLVRDAMLADHDGLILLGRDADDRLYVAFDLKQIKSVRQDSVRVVLPVHGYSAYEGLPLSESEAEQVRGEVNIIFHESLDQAVRGAVSVGSPAGCKITLAALTFRHPRIIDCGDCDALVWAGSRDGWHEAALSRLDEQCDGMIYVGNTGRLFVPLNPEAIRVEEQNVVTGIMLEEELTRSADLAADLWPNPVAPAQDSPGQASRL